MEENLKERLDYIENVLFTLQLNSARLESESSAGLELESEDTESLPTFSTLSTSSTVSSANLASELEEYIDGLGLTYFRGREFTPYWSRTCGSGGIRNSAPPRGFGKMSLLHSLF